MGSLALVACGNDSVDGLSSDDEKVKSDVRAEFVCSVGGIEDQGFNQLVWSGMKRLEQEQGWTVSYIDSKQTSDYQSNLSKAISDKVDMVWGAGEAMGSVMASAAAQNTGERFACIDWSNDTRMSNLTGVMFKQQEAAFAVGYIAACVTRTGKVGFVGGVKSDLARTFEYGFYAGIEYANARRTIKVSYEGQWTNSFEEADKGKALAKDMIADGFDVVFQAAGAAGIGVIEACDEGGIWCIGVDQDQAHLAPQTIITSAVKRADEAVVKLSPQIVSGKLAGGGTVTLGAADNAVGIAPTHDLLDSIKPGLYEEALSVLEKIKDGEIDVPKSAEKLKAFVEEL